MDELIDRLWKDWLELMTIDAQIKKILDKARVNPPVIKLVDSKPEVDR
jgi:hypothetical protein